MPRLGLKEEEEVGVLLHLAVVRKVAFGSIDVFEVLFDFVLLNNRLASRKTTCSRSQTISSR